MTRAAGRCRKPVERILAAACIPVLLAAGGCADALGEAATLPPPEERRAAAFELREVARSGEDAPFTQVTGIDADSRGRIFVADWFTAQVTVLGPDGRLLGTWGRKGLGPGEFRSLAGVQVLPGDSVFAYDRSAARATVFTPDGAAAYVVNLFDPAPFHVWRLPGGDGYVALTRPPFRGGDTARRLDEVRLLGPDARSTGEPLRVFPSRSFLHVQQGGSFSVMPNPFGHEGFVAVGPRRVHVAWSDSLGAVSYDFRGEERSRFAVPYEPPRVTRGDVDALLADVPEPMVRTFGRALADSAPERWPPLRGLLADERGRAWLAVPSPVGTPREWAAFDEGGRYLGSVFLPAGDEARAIRGDRLYAVTEEGSQVVAFEIGPRRR